MARPKQKKFFDKNRIIKIREIEFLYWQYARRKFQFDFKDATIDSEKFEEHYLKLFEYVDSRCSSNSIAVFNEIISEYNNSITDNPEFLFNYTQSSDIDFLRKAIQECEESVAFIRKVCTMYGYYPIYLIYQTDALSDYKDILDRSFKDVESFIRVYKYSEIVRAHFVSKNKTCYFEDHERDFIYVYCDACSDINIDSIIKDVRITISHKGKRNFSNVIRYATTPNMQLCIKIDGEVNIREIENEVRFALLCAMNYYVPFKYSFSKEIQDVHWRILQAKFKKISYLRRFIGLFIWDMVHIQDFKLSDIITALIDSANGLEPNLPFRSIHTEEIIKEIMEWGDLIRDDNSRDGELETRSLDREYRLACQSIQTMSICQHMAGNAGNNVILKG